MEMEASDIHDNKNLDPEKSVDHPPDKSGSKKSSDDFSFDDLLSFPLTKKKKKKVPFSVIEPNRLHEIGETMNSENNQELLHVEITLSDSKTYVKSPDSENASQASTNVKTDEPTDIDADLNFEGIKKKKRKSTKQLLLLEEDPFETRSVDKKAPVSDRLWNVSDEDYTYDYLLSRFYSIAQQDRPSKDTFSGKLTLKPPLIFRVGSKKTSFANFIDICRALHRPPQHLMSFLLVEMGTSGSLDGNNHLIIKGRFQQKQIENILRRYIKEYVRCVTCNSLNTMMQKEIRLTFLMCENCESKRSVVSIKSGFQAVTGKRAAMRAKTDA